MSKLMIADGLAIPDDVVTQALAFMGRRGSGKSYAAGKLAELIHGAGGQFVFLDPVGIHWGLRLSSDGKSKGLDIPIFGGLHGDLPLEATGGALIADIIVERNLSAIVDVSQFESDSDKARFASDFAARFFFLKKSRPSAVHIFVEEAQEFIPQNIQKGEEKMLHNWQRLIRLGRNYGIGVSMISQRPQDVAKKALNQAECLFCFQLTGPQERKAIEGWIAERGLEEDLGAVLPQLKVGQAHIWSPVWLDINATFHIAKKETFAAGSTPKLGAKPVRMKPLAPLELEQLAKDMQATVQRAKESDPVELKKRIRELEAQLAKSAKPAKVVATVDHAALKQRDRYIRKLQDCIQQAAKRCEAYRIRLGRTTLDEIGDVIPLMPSVAVPDPDGDIEVPAPVKVSVTAVSTALTPKFNRELVLPKKQSGDDKSLGKGLERILAALAQHGPSSRARLAALTGYAKGGGSFRTYVSALRTRGLIVGTDPLQLTREGQSMTTNLDPLPTGAELREHWRSELGKGPFAILDSLITNGEQDRQTLAAATGFEVSGGSFRTYLSKLRTLGLIEGGSSIDLTPEFREAIRG